MTTYKATRRFSKDVKRLMRDAEDVLKATATIPGDKVEQARGRMATALKSAKAACGRLQDGTVRAGRTTDRTIRANPYRSLGIALGAGLLVGTAIARRY
jgi:ElaB/YqjD/DUF883 family membrane-anchored ribosome-binding protein